MHTVLIAPSLRCYSLVLLLLLLLLATVLMLNRSSWEPYRSSVTDVHADLNVALPLLSALSTLVLQMLYASIPPSAAEPSGHIHCEQPLADHSFY